MKRVGEAFEFAFMILFFLLAFVAGASGLIGLGYGIGKSECPVRPPCAVESSK